MSALCSAHCWHRPGLHYPELSQKPQHGALLWQPLRVELFSTFHPPTVRQKVHNPPLPQRPTPHSPIFSRQSHSQVLFTDSHAHTPLLCKEQALLINIQKLFIGLKHPHCTVSDGEDGDRRYSDAHDRRGMENF